MDFCGVDTEVYCPRLALLLIFIEGGGKEVIITNPESISRAIRFVNENYL